jgi:hypothetical protein
MDALSALLYAVLVGAAYILPLVLYKRDKWEPE